jgi:hypothetical protein
MHSGTTIVASLGVVVALVCLLQIRKGFRTGIFMGRNAVEFHISRVKEPLTFWSQIAFLATFSVGGLSVVAWALSH